MVEMASRTTTLVKAIPLDQHRKEVPQAAAPAKRDRDPLSRFIAHRVAESATSDGPNPTFRTKFLDAITVDTDPGRADDRPTSTASTGSPSAAGFRSSDE